MSLRSAALTSALVASIVAGYGDHGIDADRLVDQLNDHGAGLELGEQLPSSREGSRSRGSVSLPVAAARPRPAAGR